jgi:prevent-host-death family protein
VAVVNTHEAKTHLSRLIDRALAGEEVVIARAGRPVVKLQPVADTPRRRFGTGKATLTLLEGWDDPMTEEELADWYGTEP